MGDRSTTGRHGTPHGDSAGTPWAGRTLVDSPFAGDDGTLDADLAALLEQRPVDVEALVALLPGQRLFVPVTAVSAGTVPRKREGPPEQTAGDLGADMAIPTLRSPDGRAALPVFTSVAALTAWSPRARPVPVEARRAAVSAVQEGQQLLVLDPGSDRPVVLPRPAVWALAQGHRWTPSPRDPEVAAAVARTADGLGGVVEVIGEAGAAGAPELRVVVVLVAGAGGASAWAKEQVAARLAASEVVAERVDAVELVTAELPRALLRALPNPNGVVRRWYVAGWGTTPGRPEHTTTFHRTRRAAEAFAARLCTGDGGHAWRPTGAGPGRERCAWCPQERPSAR